MSTTSVGQKHDRGMGLLLPMALLLAALTTAAAAPVQEPPKVWRVLVLNGGDLYLPAGIRQEQALRSALTARAPGRVEFRTEALDAVSFDFANYEAEFLALLRRKHQGLQFDLIMPMGDVTLHFAERHRSELWPGVPIVFFSVGTDVIRGHSLGPGVTGVTIAFDVQGTVDLAVRMQPSARRVVVVVGAADYDRSWLPEVTTAIGRHTGLQTTVLESRSLDGIFRDLAGVPADAIVLYTSISRDGVGRPLVSVDLIEDLARISPAPVYGFIETHLGRGIVGGSMSSFDAQGQRAAEIAFRVLSGERAETIPVQPAPRSVPMVDWRQLRKWGFSEGSLPAGSRVLSNLPPSGRNTAGMSSAS